MDIEEIRNIKKKAEDDLLIRPGVTGVDIKHKMTGGKETDALAIVVYVEKKGDYRQEDEIPMIIQGVPTDVVERNIRLHKLTTEVTHETTQGDPQD